jgi:hypothetical protein
MTRFAHPLVFRASAFDGRGDTWTADALHLRVRVSGDLGFPIHPFAAWRVTTDDASAQTVWVATNGARATPPFDPGPIGGAFGIILPLTGAAGSEWYWLAVDADAHGSDFAVDVLDRYSGRVLATRRKPPFEFGGTAMSLLRVRGKGAVRGVRGVPASMVPVTSLDGQPTLTFGPPLNPGPWFDGSPTARQQAEGRLTIGASKRLGPLDRPDGSVVLLNPAAEAARVLNVLAPQKIDDWLTAAFQTPSTPPPLVLREGTEPSAGGRTRTASLRAVDALLTMSVDPDVARYLGLATAVTPAASGLHPKANVWMVVGRWAVPDAVFTRLSGPLASDPVPNWLVTHLDNLFPAAKEIFGRYMARANESWKAITLIAVAVAAGNAPPDVPPAPSLAPSGRRLWYVIPEGTFWSQTLQFTEDPCGMIAAARIAPGSLTMLNVLNPDGRHAPLLANTVQDGARCIADTQIPPSPSGASWRVWQADEWGRWSPATVTSGPLPARPLPPPPEFEDWWAPAALPDDDTPRTPGVLRLRVEVPASAKVAPGGNPVQELRLACAKMATWRVGAAASNGANASFPVSGQTAVLVEALPAPTPRAGKLSLSLSLTFADTEGRVSAASVRDRLICDPRAPRTITTGPKLIWASASDPTGWSELSIEWDADPAADGYRVHLGDERRLASALGLPVNETDLRAKRARLIWERRGDLADKGTFTLLTEELVRAEGALVKFATRLPGTLRGVQFLRVIPVGPSGVEAEFASCGLTPLALPSAERPPTPVLHVRADPAGTAAVTLEAPGLRTDLTAGGPPEYRIRRTRSAVTDSLYMPIVNTGTLTAAGAVWTVVFQDGGVAPLPAFVKHTWVAEIRYAPELDLEPAVVAVDGAIRPGGGASRGACPAAWSDPSLPAASIVVPNGPSKPVGVSAVANPDGSATIKIPALPLHPLASGANTAVVYRDTGTSAAPGVVSELARVALAAPANVRDPTKASTYRVIISDPLGRLSDVAVVQPV